MKSIILTLILLIMVSPVFAIDLGEGKTLDIEVIAGTFIDVDTDSPGCTNSDLQTITLQREAGNWYGEVDVALKINSIAPFVAYENRWDVYDELEVGVDYYITDNVATRVSWVNRDTENVAETDQGFVGMKLTF